MLYLVQWDTGQQSGHYLKDLLCIRPFQTLVEFERAIMSGREAKLLLGPRGEFRRFTMEVSDGDSTVLICISHDQRGHWVDLVEPLLRCSGLAVERTRLAI